MTVFVSGGRNSHVSDFTGEVGRQEGRSRPMRCSVPFPGLPRSWEGKAAPRFPYGQAFAHLNLPERIPAAPQHLHCADQLEMGMQTPSPLGVLCTSSPWGQPRQLSGVKVFLRRHSYFPAHHARGASGLRLTGGHTGELFLFFCWQRGFPCSKTGLCPRACHWRGPAAGMCSQAARDRGCSAKLGSFQR